MIAGFQSLVDLTDPLIVTIYENGMSFTQNVVSTMHAPAQIEIGFNPGTKLFLIQGAEEKKPGTVPFAKEAVSPVKIGNRRIVQILERNMGWDFSDKNYRAEGTYDAAENAVIFDLSKAKEVAKRTRKEQKKAVTADKDCREYSDEDCEMPVPDED